MSFSVDSDFFSEFMGRFPNVHPDHSIETIARNNANLKHAHLQGTIWAQRGRVSAEKSTLSGILAYRDITLIDSSAANIESQWGSIKISQTDGIQRSILGAKAHRDVTCTNATAKGPIYAECGKITAENSQLHAAKAYFTVRLTNSSAKDVKSDWDSVIARQTRAETIEARRHVFLENADVGSVATSQGGLTALRCSLKDAACCQQAILHDSKLESLRLEIDPAHEAVLDLTNTKVADHIVVKLTRYFEFEVRKESSILAWLFGWRTSPKVSTYMIDARPRSFSLLIKGTDGLPPNLFFDVKGYDFAFQETSKGLVCRATRNY